MTSPARLLEAREPCTLLKNFIARQGVILIAGLVFVAWTASRLVKHVPDNKPTAVLRAQGASTRPKVPLTAADEPQGAPCHLT